MSAINTTFEKVAKCLNELIPGGEIKEGSELRDDLGLDSLSLVSVIVKLEENLGITFDDSDLDPAILITVKNLVDLAEKYL